MTRNPRHNPDPRVTENQRAFLLGVAVSCARRKDGISGVLPNTRRLAGRLVDRGLMEWTAHPSGLLRGYPAVRLTLSGWKAAVLLGVRL